MIISKKELRKYIVTDDCTLEEAKEIKKLLIKNGEEIYRKTEFGEDKSFWGWNKYFHYDNDKAWMGIYYTPNSRLIKVSGKEFISILKETTMKKSQLKTGMIVETAGGNKAIVILGTDIMTNDSDVIIFSNYNWIGLKSFNEDLLWHLEEDGSQTEYAKTININKVYKAPLPSKILDYQKSNSLELIWERPKEPEIVEMTMDDVCKALGKRVKIIK